MYVGSIRRNWHPSSNLLDRANCCNKTSWVPQCTMLAENARTCLSHCNNMQTHGKICATTCFCISQQVQRCLCRNSFDCANWTCHPAIQRHGVAYPRLHKTRDALISYCKFPAVRNWLMNGEWAIADRGLHFPNIIYRIDEVYHIIIFHCIWHSCLSHGKDGICRGDSQILVSSRAVTKMWPWHVSVGPAGHPVLLRATRRDSEEETRNHHPASHWGEHGTIAAWHRTWCWIEGRRLDVFRFYTNLEPEPSGMLTGSVTRLFSDDGDLRVSRWFGVFESFTPCSWGHSMW